MKKPAAWSLALLAALTLGSAAADTIAPMPPTLDTDSLALQPGDVLLSGAGRFPSPALTSPPGVKYS